MRRALRHPDEVVVDVAPGVVIDAVGVVASLLARRAGASRPPFVVPSQPE